MSFSKTIKPMYDEDKDVTRRLGWFDLEVGMKLQAIEKGQGLAKGEKVKKIHIIIVTKVTIEPLEAICDYPDDCRREGFPDMTPEGFIDMFINGVGGGKINRRTQVARIEFRHDNGKRRRVRKGFLGRRQKNAGTSEAILQDTKS